MLACLCVALFVIASQLFNISEDSQPNNNSYRYSTTLKNDKRGDEVNNQHVNKNIMVDSNVDSLKNDEDRKKPSNSNKIKFVKY